MIIRPMDPIDMPEMIEHGHTWWAETHFGKHVSYDPSSLLAVLRRSAAEGLAIVAEQQFQVVGFICGITAPCLANHAILMGNEVFWWVHPSHRGSGVGTKLLSAIESAAKTAGCAYWSMMCMQSHDPERAGRIYEQAGYSWTERTYTKDLTSGSSNVCSNRGVGGSLRGV